jgi:hypothetical protein
VEFREGFDLIIAFIIIMNIVEKIPEDPKMLLLTMELNRIAFEREMVNARQERERNQNDSEHNIKKSSVK